MLERDTAVRYRMFCAEYKGVLVLSYINSRSSDVRRGVCNSVLGPGLYSPDRWRGLMKQGWRVVPVTVGKARV